jgi:CRP-like cAMP-binding protein
MVDTSSIKLPGHAADTSSNVSLLRGIGMARGRRTSLTIRLTAEERQTLLAWQRSMTIPAGIARRGQIILLIADRMPLSHIAATVGISRRFIYKWAQRFVQEGLAGLADKRERRHRTGPPPHDRLDQHDMDVG